MQGHQIDIALVHSVILVWLMQDKLVDIPVYTKSNIIHTLFMWRSTIIYILAFFFPWLNRGIKVT